MKPTRIVFDANFLDRLDAATPVDRDRVLAYVRSGVLEFFATEELLREVMGIAKDPAKHQLLVRFGRHILDLIEGKVLGRHIDLMQAELEGKPALLMEREPRKQILEFLGQLAGGRVPTAATPIGERAIDDKKKAKIDYNAMFSAYEVRFGALDDTERAKISYEEVQLGWWRNKGRDTVRRLCIDWGIANPDGVADRVMAHPERYPRVSTWGRVFALNMHRYYVMRSSRDRGDLFDLWQMMYLIDADVFLTNETKLPAWYRDVYGTARRVMTWEEFIAQSWS